ncbi:MAG: PQQ-binding-like beta-propeller repeat protein [Aureliella sp.]
MRVFSFPSPICFNLAVVVLLWASVPNCCWAGDWRQFRGPTGQGIAEADPPIEFGVDSAVKWKTPIAGKGWSSPVVQGDKIWLTSAVVVPATKEEREAKLAGDKMASIKEVAGSIELFAICVDFETGSVVHRIELASFDDPEPVNPLNSFASPTPIIDGQQIFVDFGNYGTWCLNSSSGDILWKRRYEVDYSVGPGSSPFLLANKLILVCDGIDQQYVVALERSTGKELWRTNRPPKDASNVEFHKAYSTPVAIQVAGQTQVVIPTAQWVCGYRPEDGKELWRFNHGRGFSVSPSPIFVDGLVVFSTGYMRPELVAVDPTGKGDVTDSKLAWRMSRGVPAMPSPILAGEKIYMISDDGILSQLDPKTGDIQWKERVAGQFSASPVTASGRIYLCSREGIVTVVQAGSEYKELARNKLDSRLMASPAIVGDELVIRTEESLYRIGR